MCVFLGGGGSIIFPSLLQFSRVSTCSLGISPHHFPLLLGGGGGGGLVILFLLQFSPVYSCSLGISPHYFPLLLGGGGGGGEEVILFLLQFSPVYSCSLGISPHHFPLLLGGGGVGYPFSSSVLSSLQLFPRDLTSPLPSSPPKMKGIFFKCKYFAKANINR